MPRRRCAIVIGVNKTGGLPALEGSASGAETFGIWLAAEGFEVKTITDATGPVTAQQIVEAVESFVKPGNCDQLIIYFSGHGYWKNNAELWLLTGAPGDANAAVSWAETAEFAKDCGIPNVVLISDACRSIPDSPRALKVRGSVIFPNEVVQRTRATVDKFMAAAEGTAAYEIQINGKDGKTNLFTHCFLRAFSEPDPDMIHQITEDDKDIQVVPNRKLGKYLQREVSALLSTINMRLNQRPDAEVLSDDDVYIGRAGKAAPIAEQQAQEERFDPKSLGDIADVAEYGEPSRRAVMRKPSTPPVVHLRDVADMAISRALDESPEVARDELQSLETLAQTSGFNDAIAQASILSPQVLHFETKWGFAVLGAGVVDAIVASGQSLKIVARGEGRHPGIVRIEDHLAPACTALIRFSNGRATVLAGLHGFVGHVLVDDDKVINVSYVPSDKSKRWPDYLRRRERLERLRAVAAAAVRLGVFRLDDKKKAAEFAEGIRLLKGLDPSLGLYAAYAYSDADRRDDINSVLRDMNEDLHADLFDIAMLARKIAKRQPRPIVPFCPMLTQGWNLLRARGVKLPGVLNEAQDELEQGLWTTFQPERAKIIFEAARGGEFR